MLHFLAQGFPFGPSTGAARYQQLSLNPGKLAGQCGKLKCCLNFELDQYVEAVKEFPSPNAKIRTPKGKAVVFKMDIFKRLVYFLQLGEPGASPIAMNVEDANDLIAASAKGDVVGSLAAYELEEEPEEVDATFGNVVGQGLTRFDEAKRKRRRGKRRGKPSNASKQGAKQGPKDSAKGATSEEKKAKPWAQPPQKGRQGRVEATNRRPLEALGLDSFDGHPARSCGEPPLMAESKEVSMDGWPSGTLAVSLGRSGHAAAPRCAPGHSTRSNLSVFQLVRVPLLPLPQREIAYGHCGMHTGQ